MKKILILFLLIYISCKKNTNEDWAVTINGVTSASSPMAIDLNGDDIKDIVIGAGGDEWQETDKGIIALNGANGEVLWQAAARNQIVGSAIFEDLNNDGKQDVIIGGRSAELQALDGTNGKPMWKFFDKPGKMSAKKEGWFNFYNAQIVPDQNNDGINDILICNGGDAELPAGFKYRPAGKIMIISGKSGKVLHMASMPDKRETYFSPLLIEEAKIHLFYLALVVRQVLGTYILQGFQTSMMIL